jgi:hypothetical protein
MRSRLALAAMLGALICAAAWWSLSGIHSERGDSFSPDVDRLREASRRAPFPADVALRSPSRPEESHEARSGPIPEAPKLSPDVVAANAPSASSALSSLRAFSPSADVVDTIASIAVACAQSSRSKGPLGRIKSPEWEGQHIAQVQRFHEWCGNEEDLRLALAEAKQKSGLAPPGNSHQDRVSALRYDPNGGLSGDSQAEALAILFETNSLAITDGLASGLVVSALSTNPPGAGASADDRDVRSAHIAYLASAMILCRRDPALCAPGNPRTMLDCMPTGLCSPDRSLLDFRYAMANGFEREQAERLVAQWVLRRRSGG